MKTSKSFNQLGFSLVEVILAVAIFGLFATALIGLLMNSYGSNFQAKERDVAVLYAQQGMDAVLSIRRQAWNLLANGSYGLTNANNYWEFSGTSELLDDKYTRVVTIADACRNLSNNIVDCPGDQLDLNTKKVTVAVTYTGITTVMNQVELVNYLTTWQSRDWVQTDWDGGAGQAVWSNPARYANDDGSVDVTTDGQVSLAEITGTGVWELAGGEEANDETDTDFNQGTFSGTVVNGSGASAKVELQTSQSWVAHASSQATTTQNLNSVAVVSASNVWAVGNSGVIIRYAGDASWALSIDTGNETWNDLAAVSASDIWTVGNAGAFARWNGTSWTESTVGSITANLLSASVVSASNVWAAGSAGKIVRYNGTAWSEAADTGNQTWNDIAMVSATDGWVVAASGIIYRYNGTSWIQSIDTGDETWNDVAVISASDIWVVGNSGALAHWNGSTWTESTTSLAANWLGVSAVAANDIWVVSSVGNIFHYNGTTWSAVTSPFAASLNGVAMVSATQGWAVGAGGRIANYGLFYPTSATFISRVFDGGSGATWNSLSWTESLPAGTDITIAVRSGNTPVPDGSWSVWSAEMTQSSLSQITVPAARYLQYRATLTHIPAANQTPSFDNITIFYNSPTNENINEISAVSGSDIWAVANNGVVIHYNGTQWSQHSDLGTSAIYTIDMVNPSAGWAAGASGKIYQYVSPTWSEFVDLGTNQLNGIDMIDVSTGWIAGNTGRFYRLLGGVWSQFTDVGNSDQYSLFMVDATNGSAAGSAGEVYWFNGTGWVADVDTGSQQWNAVFMATADDGWIAGSGGSLYHWNVTSWVSAASPTGENLNDIYMVSPTNGWAVGDNGTIIHWDGSAWTDFASPTSQNLYGITMISANEGWIVGAAGTILKFNGTASGYQTAGSLTSSAFNMGAPSSVNLLSWSQDLSSCSPNCTIQVQLRTAPDSGGSPGAWSSWYGAAGAGTYFTSNAETLIPGALNFNQWIQYRVELAGDGLTTPMLTGINVNYTP